MALLGFNNQNETKWNCQRFWVFCTLTRITLFSSFLSFSFPSFCSISAFSCTSSKHHQSKKYLRFTGKPKVIHSRKSFFVQNGGFTVLCITWQFLNSQRKMLLAVWQACRNQVLSPCQTPNNMYPAGGGDGDPPHPSPTPQQSSTLPVVLRLVETFPLPGRLEPQISKVCAEVGWYYLHLLLPSARTLFWV